MNTKSKHSHTHAIIHKTINIPQNYSTQQYTNFLYLRSFRLFFAVMAKLPAWGFLSMFYIYYHSHKCTVLTNGHVTDRHTERQTENRQTNGQIAAFLNASY